MTGGNAVRPARTKPDTREAMCQALVRPVNIIRHDVQGDRIEAARWVEHHHTVSTYTLA
jgi:hypothetical protein